MGIQKVLIIHGGTRSDGTSYSFSRTLKALFQDRGVDAELLFLTEYPRKKGIEELVVHIEKVDMVGFVFPLYIDLIYAPNMEVMEVIYTDYKEKLKEKYSFGIGHCGFPDITRCEPIVDYLRFFGDACGMKWCGGLGYGGSPMINGAYLEDFGKEGRKIIAGFTQAVDELIEGREIPKEVQDKIEVKLPRITYRFWTMLLSHVSRKKGKKQRVTDFLKPVYLEGDKKSSDGYNYLK